MARLSSPRLESRDGQRLGGGDTSSLVIGIACAWQLGRDEYPGHLIGQVGRDDPIG